MPVRIVDPAAAIVTTDMVKTCLQISDSGSDALIGILLKVAQAEIEPPDSWIGRAFGIQTLELSLDGCEFWPAAEIPLPFPPFREVVSVTYLDAAGSLRTVDPATYTVTGRETHPVLVPSYGSTWPAARRTADAVKVRYRAGYETGSADLEPARMAVIFMVQRLKAMGRPDVFLRKEVTEGVGSQEWALTREAADILKDAAENLLSRYRIWCAP